MTPALLIGREPGQELGYCYVTEPPYEAVVIGSLSLGQLLRFREERVLEALAQGKQVLLYTPGLPQVPRNRALAGSLAGAEKLGRAVYGRWPEAACHRRGSQTAAAAGGAPWL